MHIRVSDGACAHGERFLTASSILASVFPRRLMRDVGRKADTQILVSLISVVAHCVTTKFGPVRFTYRLDLSVDNLHPSRHVYRRR